MPSQGVLGGEVDLKRHTHRQASTYKVVMQTVHALNIMRPRP